MEIRIHTHTHTHTHTHNKGAGKEIIKVNIKYVFSYFNSI